MAKKQTTYKRDAKTGKFTGKDAKAPRASKKNESKNRGATNDKVGTSGTGAKNLRGKK